MRSAIEMICEKNGFSIETRARKTCPKCKSRFVSEFAANHNPNAVCSRCCDEGIARSLGIASNTIKPELAFKPETTPGTFTDPTKVPSSWANAYDAYMKSKATLDPKTMADIKKMVEKLNQSDELHSSEKRKCDDCGAEKRKCDDCGAITNKLTRKSFAHWVCPGCKLKGSK